MAGPLHALLDKRAEEAPDALAFRHLIDGETLEETVTCGELSKRARLLAAGLTARKTKGRPVLIMHPPGIGFIASLFACWHAGAIAVPVYPARGARHRQRLRAVMEDCRAGYAMVPNGTAQFDGLEFLETGSLMESGTIHASPAIEHPGPCLLQYTSGSTAAPKGVMISHQNFRSHFRSLGCYAELGIRSALSWLPPYHDMGLVLKILYAFEAGIPLTLFSPEQFIQKPARWLSAISRYRSELSGAPNFAFDACVRSIRDDELAGVDLSCWKAAPCGAERVRPETLARFTERFAPYGFRAESFLPGYGLAETTLIVTATPSRRKPHVTSHPQAGRLVSSGAPLPGVELRIADPVSGQSVPDGEIGEIRLKGPVVSSGYWNHPQETKNTFGDDGELHSGDLGFLANGELHVTGRIKDLIIIDGANIAPDDIETAVMAECPEIAAVAAFANDSDERESIVLALEVPGLQEADRGPLCRRVRAAIADNMELSLERVLLVRPGTLPRTTSGKIRRSECGRAIVDGSLRVMHDDSQVSSRASVDLTDQVLRAAEIISGRRNLRATDDVISAGMDSLDATRLSAQLRAVSGSGLSVGEIFNAGSFARIAECLASTSAIRSGLPENAKLPESGVSMLSHAQERMWFLHQLAPASAAYHVFGCVELTGPLSASRLRDAYHAVVARHDILRSKHGNRHGAPSVRIACDVIPDLEVLRAAGDVDSKELLSDFARKPFDLAEESPIRALLVASAADRHILAICAHHIVVDGWSMRLLVRELADFYAAPQPRGKGPSYLEYAARHRAWVESGAVDPQIKYWKSKLAGHPGIIHLPTDFPRPSKITSGGALSVRVLSADLCENISALARQHRTTPFTVHLTAFLLLLHQHGAGGDCVVAIPVANRNHAEAADLIGSLVNTLPFRMTLRNGESFQGLLERVREASFEMLENQDAPFEKIIEAVKPDRAGDHAPLAQVMFDHQEIPIAGSWAEGLSCKPHLAHRGAAQFDLSLLLTDFSDHQQIAIEYRTDLFLPATIEAMMERHLAILARIRAEPGIHLNAVTCLPAGDLAWLDKAGAGPARPHFIGKTTPDLIARRVSMHPQRVAATAGGGTLTYQELGARSDRLANTLQENGVRPGDRVAVLLERDLDLPVAILAIWKAGAAYVPLDRANPPERLRLILADQEPLRILVSESLRGHLPPEARILLLEKSMMPGDGIGFPSPPSGSPAYVIHTSGSTGRPKGVVVSHGALANFLLSMAETPGFTEADRLLAITTVSFDISCLEILLPLITGGSLELVSTAISRDGHGLLQRMSSCAPTVMQATPATWRMLLDAGWRGSPELKILCGGEALDHPLASKLAGMGCQLWNLYGPTETTVWSTCWRVPENPKHIRIGRPIANTGLHILADDGTPLPPGVPGELWISGTGLADGYWNQPQLTGQRFREITSANGGVVRAYQTGDIARWHADGSLECLGRSDGQVKIRGFRVELGEIETVLATHPKVGQAKCSLRGDSPATAQLVAWVTLANGEIDLPLDELRDFLSTRLPHHMLPADIGVIGAFPLTSSGKLDVSQLAAPLSAAQHEGPLTATETQVMAIWSQLLGRQAIHPGDQWFHIGGHSLLALKLFARIHQDLGCRLPISTILDHPTPRALAAVIDQSPEATP